MTTEEAELLVKTVVIALFVSCAARGGVPLLPGGGQLAYATYVGTGANSYFAGLAVDSAGFAYVAGTGTSANGLKSGILIKLNQNGTAAVWATTIPVSSATDVKVDAAGNIVVLGADLPFAGYDFQSSTAVSIVIKLAPNGQDVIYSTVIAGAAAGRLALDGIGAAYVMATGDATFVPTQGAYSTTPHSGPVVVKLDPSGMVDYATYVDLASIRSIAVDSVGQAWVAGNECPPAQAPSCDPRRFGMASALEKLDAQGANVLVKTSFGGGSAGDSLVYTDFATGVAVDMNDNVWVVGMAESDSVPVTPNAIEPVTNFDSLTPVPYVIKLSAGGDYLSTTEISSNLSPWTVPEGSLLEVLFLRSQFREGNPAPARRPQVHTSRS